MGIVYGPKWLFYSCCDYTGLFGTGFMQVLYLGRAPRTKETLSDFLKWRQVTRHPLVFRRLTGSQRTPGFGASHMLGESNPKFSKTLMENGDNSRPGISFAHVVISTLKLSGWPTNLVFSQLKEYLISLNYYKDIYP